MVIAKAGGGAYPITSIKKKSHYVCDECGKSQKKPFQITWKEFEFCSSMCAHTYSAREETN